MYNLFEITRRRKWDRGAQNCVIIGTDRALSQESEQVVCEHDLHYIEELRRIRVRDRRQSAIGLADIVFFSGAEADERPLLVRYFLRR